MTREEALQVLRERMDYYEREKRMRAAIEVLVPEFAEKEDDRVRMVLCDIVPYMETELYAHGLTVERVLDYLENQSHDGKKWLTPEEFHRIEQLRYEAGFDAGVRSEAEKQKSLNIGAASEWLREHVCCYMNSEYNEFHKCVEYDGSIDKERLINDFEEAMQKEEKPINQCNTHEPTLDEARKWNEAYEKGYSLGYENGKNEQKPINNVSKDEYVKKFKALCDAYEIKLPNRTFDICHLCDDLAELFGNTNNQE